MDGGGIDAQGPRDGVHVSGPRRGAARGSQMIRHSISFLASLLVRSWVALVLYIASLHCFAPLTHRDLVTAPANHV